MLESKSDKAIKIEASIAINKRLGIANSKMLKAYTEIDKRFRDLVLILRHMNK